MQIDGNGKLLNSEKDNNDNKFTVNTSNQLDNLLINSFIGSSQTILYFSLI